MWKQARPAAAHDAETEGDPGQSEEKGCESGKVGRLWQEEAKEENSGGRVVSRQGWQSKRKVSTIRQKE